MKIKKLPVSAGEIDYVLLTHAILIIREKFPCSVKEGFHGDIISTYATGHLLGRQLLKCGSQKRVRRENRIFRRHRKYQSADHQRSDQRKRSEIMW